MDYPALRRSKLVDTLAGEGLDAILVGGTANVSYLTSFSGDSSYLVLGREGALLVSDGRFTQQIAEECPGLPAHIRPTGQMVTLHEGDRFEIGSVKGTVSQINEYDFSFDFEGKREKKGK